MPAPFRGAGKILSGLTASEHESGDEKGTPDHIKKIAQTADIELMKKRNVSFAEFVGLLEKLSEEAAESLE